MLHFREGMLLAPIIGLIDSRRARQLTEQLLGAIRSDRAKVVVIDITLRAMPKGGRLTIATGNWHLDDDYAAHHPEVTAGDYAVIEVGDSGTGIAPDVLGRIFEPFFTTKERGQGSGLGLAMVFGYVKQSGGHINVYGEFGVGTMFRLYLPRARGPVERAETRPAEQSPMGHGEIVLVGEDNTALRRIAVRQLRQLGYAPAKPRTPARR